MLIFLLLVPAWAMLRSSVTLLFARFPEPQGRELTRAEAPALFAGLERLRGQMNGPPVHKVLLTDEVNAAIVQYPRLGLFGWEKNILILGLPLLQILSEDEALAVVAHEYDHLSGHRSRLGGFIYRLRATWRRLQALSEQWTDWGSRLIARLFHRYALYFNAYTFVLARQNEYLADQAAVEIAGRRNAATALMRGDIARAFATTEFWPSVWRRAALEPEPLANRAVLWQESVRAAFHEDRRGKLLEKARQRKTDRFDTHPALTDRLRAIGIAADDEALVHLEPPARTAAAQWLGATAEVVQTEFDRRWRDSAAEKWHYEHAYLSLQQERLRQLDSLDTLTVDQQWERVQAWEVLQSPVDLLPSLEAMLAANPNYLPARFRRGTLMLERGNEAGIADLEAAVAADRNAILPGCQVAWRYYGTRDPNRAEQYAKRWRERSATLERLKAQSGRLSTNDQLAPADLTLDVIARVKAALRSHSRTVRRAYIVRRTLDAESDVRDHWLAFETKRFTRSHRRAELLEEPIMQFSDQRNPWTERDAYPRNRFEHRRNQARQGPLPNLLRIALLTPRIRSSFRTRFRESGIEPLPLD